MQTRRLNPTSAGWIFFISYTAGILLTYLMISPNQATPMSLSYFLLYVLAGQVGLNLLPGVVWCKLKRIPLSLAFQINKGKVPFAIWVVSILFFLVSLPIQLFVHNLTEYVSSIIGQTYEVSNYPIADSPASLLMLLLCIGIIPPLCEEFLFRGMLLSGYQVKGRLFGAVASSALFALFHDNPYRLVELFVAALLSALVVTYVRSIWPAIAIHMATNMGYVIGSYLQGGDMVQQLSSSPSDEHLNLLLSGAGALPAIFVCWWLVRKLKRLGAGMGGCEIQVGQRQRSWIGVWCIPVLLSVLVFVLKQVLS